jgi:ribosome biogenesis GTPase A
MKAVLRQEFKDLPRQINWFPGHMRKALTELETELQKANLFIEVRDARIPITSWNKELIALIKEKQPRLKRLIVVNKMDLANENRTLALLKEVKEQDKEAEMIHISTKKG